jgi:hypothetical protein
VAAESGVVAESSWVNRDETSDVLGRGRPDGRGSGVGGAFCCTDAGAEAGVTRVGAGATPGRATRVLDGRLPDAGWLGRATTPGGRPNEAGVRSGPRAVGRVTGCGSGRAIGRGLAGTTGSTVAVSLVGALDPIGGSGGAGAPSSVGTAGASATGGTGAGSDGTGLRGMDAGISDQSSAAGSSVPVSQATKGCLVGVVEANAEASDPIRVP